MNAALLLFIFVASGFLSAAEIDNKSVLKLVGDHFKIDTSGKRSRGLA